MLQPSSDSEQQKDINVTGFYRFEAPNGNRYKVTYTAGKDGTRASVEIEPSVSFAFEDLGFAAPPSPPRKLQSGDEIGCALRASLCG